MVVKELDKIKNKLVLFEKDSNGREITIYELQQVIATGESLFYPNVLLKTVETHEIFTPINETTMSLKDVAKEYKIPNQVPIKYEDDENMFFFVYNTDNYFHFIYDTLPYLITYLNLLKTDPNIKLLMNYPNPSKKEHYKFVTEFLALLGITDDNIRIINDEVIYKSVLISTSYTHDFNSNLPPRAEVYNFLQGLAFDVKNNTPYKETPKKIYVSRRSWKHGDFSNIGTNYTTRRKLINEDELVEYLESKGYIEVFTENMSTQEKICLFSNATNVIGAIGGGLSNALFLNKKAKVIAIESPHFLDVNNRFLYSFTNVNLTLFKDVKLSESTDLKTYMRVKVGNIVGEIIDINNEEITVTYSDSPIAGWNNEVEYKQKIVNAKDCVKLDNGLNSSWVINLEEFKKLEL